MFKTVNETVKRQRMSVCEDCSQFQAKTRTCRQCGCFMPAKTMFASSVCPDSKWTESIPGNSLINKLEEQILESWNKL